jgi:glutamine synthetase
MNREAAKALLKEKNVKYVLAQFVDIHGVAKAKVVPSSHLDLILDDGAGFAAFAISGMGIGPNGADYMAVGDLDTLGLLPWQPGYAKIVCDGHVNGKPHDFDSRVALKRQIALLAKSGLSLNTGLEPEFSLLKRGENGELLPSDPTDTLDKPCYDYKGMARNAEFLSRLSDAMIESGIDVYQIDHEDANGQFEINYTYSDCLKSADNYVFFKMAAKEIAHELGLLCSFMPKPFSNRPGNGMHIHLSLSDGKSNVFRDDSDKNGLGLSTLAYHFLGGVLEHAPALTAICAPSVNSYKRLVVGRSLTGATWAPAYISYGDNNRTTMVRVPYGRLELRLPDGSCNPYLAQAALIAAGMDGIKRKLDPGAPDSSNLYELTPSELKDRGINILPQNLNAALVALESDEVIKEGIGAKLAEEFITLKRMEWIEYQRHVSDWEINRYIDFY